MTNIKLDKAEEYIRTFHSIKVYADPKDLIGFLWLAPFLVFVAGTFFSTLIQRDFFPVVDNNICFFVGF